MHDNLIRLEHVSASVKLGNGELLHTVRDVSLEFARGKTYAIVGASGSGKTSLVSIIGLLNSQYTGEYYYENKLVASLSDKERSYMRADRIGFVFQNYSLIRHLNVWDNVALALAYMHHKYSIKERHTMVQAVLQEVGLEDRVHDFPSGLSGGEQQRVAIARAMVTNPEMLICDEPTGALDTQTGEKVLAMLESLVERKRTMLLLVTHDPRVAQRCQTRLTMSQGVITHVAHDA